MPVFLATDVLVWLLVVAIAAFAIYCRRRAHLAAPWARVFRSRAAVASAVFLAAFLCIGLLDSLHYRPVLPAKDASGPAAYAVEARSLLDLALTPLRMRAEKTYSAPLATRLYQKELVELPEGKSVREFPRLRHGGAHLKDEADWGKDIAWRVLAGLAAAVALWSLKVLVARRLLVRRWPQVPWVAAYAATGAILLVAGPVALLAVAYHVLGTNQVGQDVLYQALKSIRTSLVIGTITTLVLLPLGIAAGVAAGYFKGWVDDLIQYAYTTLNSIPGVLLIAAFVLMLQVFLDQHGDWFPTSAQRADMRLLGLCAILGLTSWTGLARLLRGEALKLSELEYIQAAHAFGVSHARILGRHILPNVSHIIVIALVLAANLFADAVRDGFDPRVRV